MQENLNHLGNKEEKGNNETAHNYGLLQKQLSPIARSISKRALLFLAKLFSNLINGKNF
jgi:hypothetical protein